MEKKENFFDHRKRKRRRRAERSPISGWLRTSEQLKGNIGNITDDFFHDLFHHKPTPRDVEDEHPELRYVAVTPWSPPSHDLVENSTWTILPVQAQKFKEEGVNVESPSSIHFPAKSSALQSFAEAIQANGPAKLGGKGKPGVEIKILEMAPLALDTIYVTVDGDALNKNDEVQKRFGGGFVSKKNGTASKDKGKGKATINNEINGDSRNLEMRGQEIALTAAVREALALSIVVRQNDLLSLPLPAHPITHVSLPPAKITFCEPVSQGLLSDKTKVIVSRTHNADPSNRSLPSVVARKALQQISVEDGDDTSNEQFFSAVEDDKTGGNIGPRCQAAEPASDTDSSEEDSGNSSDDSPENIISMEAPQLTSQFTGTMSSRLAATPRAIVPKANGVNTPGSVFSNFTTTTARQGAVERSRLFRAKGLLGKISDDTLHPRPAADEDDEAKIFVDIKSLLKLGCFSGDWVRLETASLPDDSRSRLWGVDLSDRNDSESEFRPVRIYGLPDLNPPSMSHPRKLRAHERRSSVATAPILESPSLVAWLSPVLLANLGNITFVKLSPLLAVPQDSVSQRLPSKKLKVHSALSPPVAKELILLRISTPVSTERALQTGLFGALKHHFERKRRVLRQGDLIALPLDVGASRLLSQPSTASEVDHEVEELLALDSQSIRLATFLKVAWFRVGQVIPSDSDEDHSSMMHDTWGGATCIEPKATRMRQAGSELTKTPSALNSSLEYYLGVKPLLKTRNPQSIVGQTVASLPKPYVAPLRRRLRELIAAAASPRAVHLGMDPMIVLLHSTQRSIGKSTIVSRAASDLGLHVFDIDAGDVVAEGGSAGDIKTEALFKARVERALSCGADCTTIIVRHVDTLSSDHMVTALKEAVSQVRVMIATTTELESIPASVRSIFTHELEFAAPDEGERYGILRDIIDERAIRTAHDVDLASIATKSAALVAGDLVDIVERAVVARQERLEQLAINKSSEARPQLLIRDLLVSGGENIRCVTKADFDVSVEAARKNFADAIGAPKIPNVSWDDVGGLENVKDAVLETIQLPLERPELFAKGMKKRSGILFYGPPGTGKTLLAKAIATEFSLNFFSVKGPELLNMYIGESEANVRRVFQRARDARPCAVFFDELDSVAPKRGNQGDSGGVMDRIVSQLLAELDGMSDGDEGAGGVFVIGATNRPDLLDQALLRPGRFDKMLYLGVSDTHDKQLTILEALTRKFTMHPETSLRRIADSLPFTYTGADLYALCSDAMLKAITRQASAVDTKIRALLNGPVTTAYFFDHLAKQEDIAVMVTQEDFFAAQKELIGSVR